MKRKDKILWIIALCLLLVAVAIYVTSGASGIGLSDILDALWGRSSREDARLTYSVITEIRIPRLLKCILCGASLAVAGVLTQGLFRNSLAAPSVLGTGSGAGLAAAFGFYMGWAQRDIWSVPLVAFIGALIFTGLLLLILRYTRSWATETILLSGLALNIFCGAVTTLIVALAFEKPEQAPELMHWLMGDFSYPTASLIGLAIGLTVAAISFAFYLGPRLDANSLGSHVGMTLGIDPMKLQVFILVTVSVLVATTVSLVGAAPFVGLIVPHFSRILIGPRHLKLTLMSAINGMTLVIVADVLARTLRAPAELPTGVLLAMIGAPFFLYMVVKGMSTRYQ